MTSASHPLSLKERQRQERHDLILRAAADLLAERGYHEMSLDDIAARVGISKGTIYLHFASKEDLVIALLDQSISEVAQRLDEALSSQTTPTETLRAVIERVPQRMNEERFLAFGSMLQNPEIHRRMAERRYELSQRWEEPRRRLFAIIEQGKALGEFDSALPTALIVQVLMSLLSPHTYRQLVTQEGTSGDEIAQGLSRFFLKGIAACGHAPPSVS